jgi:hypothetical protein
VWRGRFLFSWEDFKQKAAKATKPEVLRPSVQILFGCGCAALGNMRACSLM